MLLDIFSVGWLLSRSGSHHPAFATSSIFDVQHLQQSVSLWSARICAWPWLPRQSMGRGSADSLYSHGLQAVCTAM
eukprot:346759-Chlamydomonas_euryale.AAC.1